MQRKAMLVEGKVDENTYHKKRHMHGKKCLKCKNGRYVGSPTDNVDTVIDCSECGHLVTSGMSQVEIATMRTKLLLGE